MATLPRAQHRIGIQWPGCKLSINHVAVEKVQFPQNSKNLGIAGTKFFNSHGHNQQLGAGPELLLLQDRIVTVADEPGAHGFGLFDVGKWPDLNVEELIRARGIGRSGILFFL